ncbi:hypothetical protein AXG93_163s1420 [Marchantia polymorpha subsp. ruderalis]|uniref:Endoglucanase n=1 Tax=Marchantia polymorpha subsp. ruderalis TaxID=1480154 RepID=A0A176VC74_MARPO|nr:hypothetical protein AXG93_163s1420 [Marchantia polymorpha subsp. ruderalis]
MTLFTASRMSSLGKCALAIAVACTFLVHRGADAATIDYKDALKKSILYFEGQRSGPLPSTQRVTWRGDSGLNDGSDVGVDLVGGYYDAGDNVKFGVPMAFTATLLSWGMIEYGEQLSAAGHLDDAREALKWITDYLLKAITGPTQLWVQVGNADRDHACWERPEDMDTSRQSYQVNASYPGSEPAAETAAALAAASMVFRTVDASYSDTLLQKSVQVFTFADTYKGSFGDACPYYCSWSGYTDELLWGAAWLYTATGKEKYLNYVNENAGWSYTMNEFLWDNKLGGLQFYFRGTASLSSYKTQAETYLCENLPTSSQKTVTITPGGLLFIQDDNNMQYVMATSFLFMIFSDYLASSGQTISCGDTKFSSADLYNFAKSQASVDYVLGDNPLAMSFMVGFGENYPKHVHHRGSSIVSIHEDSKVVGCNDGYSIWYGASSPNPNTHVGALVGGPNNQDSFTDMRNDWDHLEPMTYINAPIVSILAKIIATSS